MSWIYIKIKANSPLTLSSRHFVSNEIDTLNYIPGSTFRGATADKLGREWGYDNTKFKDIFVDGKIKFGNLYLWLSDTQVCKDLQISKRVLSSWCF
jgi:CRISPR/Cas system-associated protein Cas5 (RAMP superfamily)